MLNYYKPSGKISPLAFVILLLVCAVIMPILGVIYAYATWYIPIVYINFLITIVFGISISFVIGHLLIKLGKIRNYTLSVLFAIIASLVAYYSQWVVWVDLVLNSGEVYGNEQIGLSVSNIQFEQLLYLATHPSDLIDLILLINKEGTWGIKGMTVSGVFLGIIWLIEFAVIMFFSFTTAGRSKKPFSEVTEQWFKEEILPPFTYIDNKNSFKQAAEQGKWEQILEPLQLTNRESSHSVFVPYLVANEYYLSVLNLKAKTNDKGKLEIESDEFIKYLRINKIVYDMIKAKIVMTPVTK